MSIWVLCEARAGGYRPATLELLSQARRLAAAAGGPVVAVAVGDDAGAAQALEGAAHRVVTVQGGHLSPYAADPWVGALGDVLAAEAPRLVLFGEGTRSRELLPRLAARLGAAAFTNALGLEWDGGFLLTRPVYGGKAYQTIRCGEGTCLAAFRPNSFDGGAAPVPETAFGEVQAAAVPNRVEVLEQLPRESRRVPLTEASQVVTGGRGLRAPENLALLEDLADALGGAVGVSRAVVDAGWADHAIQVGKSGKTVSPALYVVAGVSGAVHHTMGMDTAKVVVAINTDPKAPIFAYADYGVVGDALQVLPALTAAVRKTAG